MAQELLIGRSGNRAKLRSPWAVALLPFITLGIYHLVWWYRVNREMRDLGDDRGVDLGRNPTNSLLALFPGGLIIVPALVSYWRGTKRVIDAAGVAGTEPANGWIALILYIVLFPAFAAYLQVSLNHVWRATSDAPTASPSLVDPAPAPLKAGSEEEGEAATASDAPDPEREPTQPT
jgi:hypothetical protein